MARRVRCPGAGRSGGPVRAGEVEWGGLDFLLHSIAFAPKEDLHGRVVDSSAEGFALAMDVSCHASCAWRVSPSR
jgi:enoyl-[acyl-carrier-protein] reductase (NADH)